MTAAYSRFMTLQGFTKDINYNLDSSIPLMIHALCYFIQYRSILVLSFPLSLFFLNIYLNVYISFY